MYHVLVPVDTDEGRALTQAEYVASLPAAAREVVATVLFVYHGEAADPAIPDEIEQFAGDPTRIGSVRRAVDHLEDAGVETHVLGESADTAGSICRRAESEDVDAIVVGGRKRSPVGKILLGSVTQSVIQDTDRPVVVTGSHPHRSEESASLAGDAE